MNKTYLFTTLAVVTFLLSAFSGTIATFANGLLLSSAFIFLAMIFGE